MSATSFRFLIFAVVLATSLAVGACTGSEAPERAENGEGSERGATTRSKRIATSLPKDVRTAAIRRHLMQFQRISDANGGNRSAGTSGYDASALYVGEALADAGYRVSYQRFQFPAFIELRPPDLQLPSAESPLVPGEDFAALFYSPAGVVTAPVTPVDVQIGDSTPSSGCESADFEGFPAGDIALVQRSGCFYRDQAANAEAASAAGLIVFPAQELPEDPVVVGTLTPTADVSIPVVGTTYAVGSSLSGKNASRDRVRIRVSAKTETRTTANVLAETRSGDADNIVMLGAHLDSVPLGPGINDNGSGSATILEIARQLRKADIRNRVRFAFWSAEEYGLLGSFHYTEALNDPELSAIRAYLNFDMLGSPNFIRLIYDGHRSGSSDVQGSIAIQELFEGYFRTKQLDTVVSDFVANRSDQTGFALAGIPVGGLFSGADGVKSTAEQASFGGAAGVRHDPCYHLACDDLANVDLEILGQMADAASFATAILATERSALE